MTEKNAGQWSKPAIQDLAEVGDAEGKTDIKRETGGWMGPNS